MKTVFVHDWLYTYAGAERVLEQMLRVIPDADVFSLFDFLEEDNREFILNKDVTTSFLQSFPGVKKHHRKYLPLMPLAVESLDLSDYELVISSSHAVAKGVLTGPDQLHLCMCYSPIRYAWDLQHQYLRQANLTRGLKSLYAKSVLHYIRLWDQSTANTVDHFVAISRFVARRIWKYYRREAAVIYPPVNIEKFKYSDTHDNYYLSVSRIVPYKRMDLIVDAFNKMPNRKLIVIGDGPGLSGLQEIAGPNIEILGFQPENVVIDYMRKAKGFVFAAKEDFGIVLLEAQSCGTPVIAFDQGAALEIINNQDHEQPSGLFFQEQTSEVIINAVQEFENKQEKFLPMACRSNAERFSVEHFRQDFQNFINAKVDRYHGNLRRG